MGRMHADEHAIDTTLVRRLVRGRFPEWADLPVTPLSLRRHGQRRCTASATA